MALGFGCWLSSLQICQVSAKPQRQLSLCCFMILSFALDFGIGGATGVRPKLSSQLGLGCARAHFLCFLACGPTCHSVCSASLGGYILKGSQSISLCSGPRDFGPWDPRIHFIHSPSSGGYIFRSSQSVSLCSGPWAQAGPRAQGPKGPLNTLHLVGSIHIQK